MGCHSYLGAVGINELRMIAELFDGAKDIVPAATVQTRGVLPQLIEDFVHLKGRQDGLDENRRFNSTLGNAQLILSQYKHIVPQPGFQVALQLRQVKVRAGSLLKQRFDVVEEIQAKIKQSTGNFLAIDQHVLLWQVPAARANQQCGRLFI